MADPLRLLAIHVAEPDPGKFEWVITERVNDQWIEIERAEDGYKTYKAAMASGLVALEEMVSDLDVGPRKVAERADGLPTPPEGTVQPAPSDAEDAASPKGRPKKAAYFGFGPIR
ncbi:hypothetical protein [Acidovorax sp. sic0104]|uniref:hypothetical protein n=1 Tax=Acidovorax sp. sic0104 TaxID=2854784 RepID=UPI001C467459|nr:hypothetical protein [Acidovorax sp. sic0104]MBV7542679.1 hypothetical protein [Acidovorax sp. sic0104]